MNTHRYRKGDHSFDMQGAIWLLTLFFCEHVTSVIFLCPFQNVILSGVFQEVLKKLPLLFLNILISVTSIHFVRIMLK
jgi:hypothetical protein